MPRIRTAKQARRLRPVALERARQARLSVGAEVFYGGICYGMVTLTHVYDSKPYRTGILSGRHTAFFGTLTHAYPDRETYEASGVHWRGAPRV